jgi:hypothetical protein
VRHIRLSTALVLLVTSCGGDSSGPTPTPDYQLRIASGNNQSAAPGAALAQDLVVAYTDASGNPGPASTVTWAGAGLANATTTTSAAGTAANQWTIPANAAPGSSVTVTASISGETPVTFTASVGNPSPTPSCAGTNGTVHTAAITANATWSAAAGPHRVNALVEVQNGATLTIEPGAVLCFAIGASAGGLQVMAGSLDARGTYSAPIQFLPTTPGTNFVWAGLRFGAGTTSRLDHAVVDYTSLVLIHGVLLSDSTTFLLPGTIFVQPDADGTRITRARIDQHPLAGNFSAVQIFGASDVVFSGRVRSPAWWSIEVIDAINLSIQNCEVTNGGNAGIHVLSQFPQTNVTIAGCNIFNNAGQGVQNGGTGNATVNAQGNWWGDPAGPNGPNGDGISAAVDASNPLAAPVVLNY